MTAFTLRCRVCAEVHTYDEVSSGRFCWAVDRATEALASVTGASRELTCGQSLRSSRLAGAAEQNRAWSRSRPAELQLLSLRWWDRHVP